MKQQVQERAQKAARNIGGEGLEGLAGAALGKAFEWGSKKIDEAQRSHPKTEGRIGDIEAYVAREYSGGAAPPLVGRQADADRIAAKCALALAEDANALHRRGERKKRPSMRRRLSSG